MFRFDSIRFDKINHDSCSRLTMEEVGNGRTGGEGGHVGNYRPMVSNGMTCYRMNKWGKQCVVRAVLVGFISGRLYIECPSNIHLTSIYHLPSYIPNTS